MYHLNEGNKQKRLKLQNNYFGFVNLNGRYSFSDNYESIVSEQDYTQIKNTESSFYKIKTQNSFELNNKNISVLQSFQKIISQNKFSKLCNSKASSDQSHSPDFFNSTIKHLIENSFENNDHSKRQFKAKINIKSNKKQDFFQQILFQKKRNQNLQRQNRGEQLQNCDYLKKFEVSSKQLKISNNFQYSFVKKNNNKKQSQSCNKSTKSTFFQSISPGMKKKQNSKNIMQEFLQKNSYYNKYKSIDRSSYVRSYVVDNKFGKKLPPNKQLKTADNVQRKCKSQKQTNKQKIKKLYPIKGSPMTQKFQSKICITKPLSQINLFNNKNINKQKFANFKKKKSPKIINKKNKIEKENITEILTTEKKKIKQPKKKKIKIKYLPFIKDEINFQQFFYSLVDDKSFKINCDKLLAFRFYNYFLQKQKKVLFQDLVVLMNILQNLPKKNRKFQKILKQLQQLKVSQMQAEFINQAYTFFKQQNFSKTCQKLLVTIHLNGNQNSTLKLSHANEIPQQIHQISKEQNLSENQQCKLLTHLWQELAQINI